MVARKGGAGIPQGSGVGFRAQGRRGRARTDVSEISPSLRTHWAYSFGLYDRGGYVQKPGRTGVSGIRQERIHGRSRTLA